MSTRSYRLGKRAGTVEQTRSRVLDTARELLATEGFPSNLVDEVARRSGVARATVYYQFGSKVGLLEAVVGEIQRRAGQADIAAAVATRDPAQAMRLAFAAGCRFWDAEHVLIGKLTGLASIDADVRAALAGVAQGRLPLLAALVAKFVAAERLSPHCSPERAVDALWLLSSFEAYDRLAGERGRSVDEVAGLLTDLALHLIAG